MKHILFLLLFLPVLAYAQFPANPNKIRLGNQTTADGLVVRTAAPPSWTPSSINNAWLAFDTVAVKLYYYDAGMWNEYTGGNFANSNLTFTGNRVHNLSTRTLTIADGGTYPTFQQSAATDGFTLASSATDLIAQTPGLLQIENSDTITITADRIRLNAADTRIQQVTKDNALNRVMMLDSLTGQVYYRDVSSIAGGGGTVTGTGTTNTLPKWTSSTALGNSLITDDGTDVAVGGTASFRLPNGTDGQRPGTPTAGMTRYNTTNGAMEYYGSSAWEVPVKSAMATGLGTAARLPRFDAAGRIATDVLSRIDPAIGLISIGSIASLTTGTNNNFFGTNNGIANVGGVDNNFFGNSAGRANTSGSYNNFFGLLAGRNNTTGASNNFVGLSAGLANTSGGSNNFFGEEAGGANTTGSFNDFYGTYSGLANTTGMYNTFIGLSSGRANTTGQNNIAIGRGAMQTSPAALTGSYNTTVGAESNKTITGTAAGNLVLGNQVNLPTASGSNQVVIKNVIFATGASGTGTTIATGSKVGVKVAAPARDFEVAGEVRITDLTTDNPTAIVGHDADGDLGSITVGSGLSLSGGTLTATGGAGTTNLAFSGSSSPVTLTSDTGTDVIFAAGSGLSLTQSGGTATYSRTYSLTHTTITGGSTFFGTTAERPDNDTPGSATTSTVGSDFSVSGSTINYTGGSGALLRVEGSISFSVADDGDYYVSMYKEGTELGATSMRVSCVAGNYYSVSLPATTTGGSTNDTFDLRIATVSGNSTTTMHRYGFIIERIY